jgi:hypothetical protein
MLERAIEEKSYRV